jgi:hypothetical protein
VVLSGIWHLLPEADGSAPSNCTPHFLLSTNVKKQTWVGFSLKNKHNHMGRVFFCITSKKASNNTPGGEKKKLAFPLE